MNPNDVLVYYFRTTVSVLAGWISLFGLEIACLKILGSIFPQSLKRGPFWDNVFYAYTLINSFITGFAIGWTSIKYEEKSNLLYFLVMIYVLGVPSLTSVFLISFKKKGIRIRNENLSTFVKMMLFLLVCGFCCYSGTTYYNSYYRGR